MSVSTYIICTHRGGGKEYRNKQTNREKFFGGPQNSAQNGYKNRKFIGDARSDACRFPTVVVGCVLCVQQHTPLFFRLELYTHVCVCVYDLFVCYVVTSIRLVVDTGGRNTKKIYVYLCIFSDPIFCAQSY